MSDDRSEIFSRIKGALEPLPERTPLPDYARDLPLCTVHPDFPNAWELFAHKSKQVNGTPLKGLAELAKWLIADGQTHGYCDPALVDKVRALPEFNGITLETEFDRTRFDDFTFGITKAAGVIAETGTLILKDQSTSSRLGALAPWVHAAIVDEADVYPDVRTAIENFGDDPSIIWATGPSKTADVEGILIEGVHGPGIQIVCLDA
ncbi:LutC/YkgG family protein [Cerasicoccus maritimus]|uniref:LutC/YkgG family protein n=1 Tax=Cerasicoccus maritimus TaxID=490089 RepID=UPI00285259AE|nr:LUD domain-containing protein [Cerasicoccus maritimus]